MLQPHHAAPRIQRCRCIASATTAPIFYDHWYQRQDRLSRYIGSVNVATLQDKGRGVIATQTLNVGDLIMAVPPLAHIQTPERSQPDPEALVDLVIEKQQHRGPWFSMLYDGTPKSTRQIPDMLNPITFEAPPQTVEPASTSSSSKKSGGSAASGFGARKGLKAAAKAGGKALGQKAAGRQITKEMRQAALVVKYNCFGDEHLDLASAALRNEEANGHLGLWPEFALFNHSCAPSAINYVVGDSMVVRAVEQIDKGSEVTISYLGRPQLQLLRARQERLQAQYGFECNCPRCAAEAVHYDKVGDELEDLTKVVDEEIAPAVHVAMKSAEASGTTVLADATAELEAMTNRVFALYRKTLLSPRLRHFFNASIFDSLELLHTCQMASGGDSLPTLMHCLKAVEAVTPGSDLHAILAVRTYLAQASKAGLNKEDTELLAAKVLGGGGVKEGRGVAPSHVPPAVMQTLQSAHTAHLARYGHVSWAVEWQLMSKNNEMYG